MSMEAVLTGKRNWHVAQGDVLDTLRAMPSGCVNAVVTSPPYYALRSYLPADHPDKAKEHGSEPNPEAFIATMVAVFDEVRRVLRDDGVCWVNLGDSYAAGKTGRDDIGREINGVSTRTVSVGKAVNRAAPAGYKPGDKLNMPHRVAEALQAAGWWWRDTVVWHKLSPMPESIAGWKWVRCRVKVANGTMMRQRAAIDNGDGLPLSLGDGDHHAKWSPCPGCAKCEPNDGWVLRRGKWRCTQAHEYVFQLAKSAEYFCDGEAAKVKAQGRPPANKRDKWASEERKGASHSTAWRNDGVDQANPRNVLSLAHEPTKEKHFAAYPSELVRFFLLPSLAHAYCDQCGAPHAPMVVEERKATRPALDCKDAEEANKDPARHVRCSTVVGYRATCGCNAGTTTGLVLDPYCGTGTTGEVALKLGARFIGCELNPEYKAMADNRAHNRVPLFV